MLPRFDANLSLLGRNGPCIKTTRNRAPHSDDQKMESQLVVVIVVVVYFVRIKIIFFLVELFRRDTSVSVQDLWICLAIAKVTILVALSPSNLLKQNENQPKTYLFLGALS